MQLFGKYFKITFVALLFVEVISLLGYLFTEVNYLAFFAVVLAALILSLVKLEYGIYILLAELFVGSKGYLFFFDYHGTVVSLRIALFLIVMAVWFLGFLKTRKTALRQSKLFWYYILLFIAIGWAMAYGFLRNEFSNAFFDSNAWWYFALVFPLYDVIKSKEQVSRALQVLSASVLSLALKTFALLFIFSHQISELLYPIYKWVRNTGVGEITYFESGYSRIFIQSQIFNLIFLFILLCLLIYLFKKDNIQPASSAGRHPIFKDKNFILISFFTIANIAVCLISFSRSFWVGGFITSIVFLITWIYFYRDGFKFIAKTALYFIALAILSVGLMYGIINFPYGEGGGFNAAMLEDRATSLTDAAGASRWALLPELWKEIKSAPIIGAGFGKTVTYKSQDPRILEISDGIYTTYAFEWGYLDIWLKLGALGLAFYLLLLWQLFKEGFGVVKQFTQEKTGFLAWGLVLGLVVVASTSIFSPYMNHPLGIGYIMLTGVILEVYSTRLQPRV